MIHAMRRWRWVLLLLTLSALSACAFRHVKQEQSQKKREDSYLAELRSYSAVLKIGSTRKDVEDYLHGRNVGFLHMCCVDADGSQNVFDDLVKVGQEKAPWYCNEKNVYVAFQFSGPERSYIAAEAHPQMLFAP